MAPCSNAVTAYSSYAVTKTTWQTSPIDAATSSPSLTGMRMSRNATSGLSSAARAIACSPFSASPVTASSGHACTSRALSCARSMGSSSAISAVKRLAGGCCIRNLDACACSAWSDPFQREFRALTVQCLQALTQIAEPDALSCVAGEAAPGVRDRDAQSIVGAARLEPDLAACGLRLDPVLDRVLDHGHQKHRWEGMCAQRGRYIDRKCEPRTHAHLHDRQIRRSEIDFLSQRRAARAELRQRRPKIRKKMP